MKKIFILRLIIFMAVATLILIVLGNYYIRTNSLQNFHDTSKVKINQVLQILSQNKKEIDTLRAATYEDYLSKTRAVAYIIASNPEVADNNEELKNIAILMQIDEIHIFDKKGVIVAGTVPEYIGVGVNDGEQIGFFKAILENPILELVQEILPATADGKMMQYSAISRKDKAGIIEIGMKPERIMETMKRNEISHVLSTVVTDVNEVICLTSNATGELKGISNNYNKEFNFHNITFNKNIYEHSKFYEYVEFYDTQYYVLSLKTKDGIIYVAKNKESIMRNVNRYTFLLAVCLIFIAVLMIMSIKKLLEIHVIHGVKEIISGLRKITDGKLETAITVKNNPELKELSQQINTMVGYLVHSTSKISKIIDSLDINIAVYEYEKGTPKVKTTSRLGSILDLNAHEEQNLFNNKYLFEKKISLICQNFQDREDKRIYRIPSVEGYRYIKIKTFNDPYITTGIVIDITDDIIGRDIMMYERDYDVVTDIYNRRAFVRESLELFSDKKQLKISCIMMLDIDYLKNINDKYGHQVGDKYLLTVAEMLRQSQLNEKVIISRLGSDEYAIMWYGYKTQAQIKINIKRLHEVMLETSTSIDGTQKHPVSLSAGYAFYPEHAEEKSALLKLSDIAMRYAKIHHKSSFIQYDPTMSKDD